MTFAAVRAFCIRLPIFGLTVVAAAATAVATSQGQLPAASAPTHLKDSKDGFAKSEIIIGTLSGVDPAKGLIIVIRRGPHEPPSLQLSWTERSDGGGHVERSSMTVSQGLGETDYDFRVTSSTLIEVNGAPASLESLAALTNAEAKVRFRPRHDGDFALEITISH